MYERIFRCPYSAILSIHMSSEIETGLVYSKNVPWPFTVYEARISGAKVCLAGRA